MMLSARMAQGMTQVASQQVNFLLTASTCVHLCVWLEYAL